MRIALLSLLTILCLALGTTAFAGTVFSEGPIMGYDNSLFIDGPGGPFGQSISDGFMASGGGNTVNATISFGEWVLAGDTPTGVSYALSNSQNFGGTFYSVSPGNHDFNATVFCHSGGSGCDPYGYDVYTVSFKVASGEYPGFNFIQNDNYYLSLTDALDSQHTGYNGWDITSPGPAACYFESGTIVPGNGGSCGYPGESFTITSGGVGTTPEPSSILLFGSGILGLAGVLRRKLNR